MQVLRNALRDKLTREGFVILEARNGQEGLDIVMPRMDGMTMLMKLREPDWGKTVKVLVLTNLSDNAKIAQSFEFLTGAGGGTRPRLS